MGHILGILDGLRAPHIEATKSAREEDFAQLLQGDHLRHISWKELVRVPSRIASKFSNTFSEVPLLGRWHSLLRLVAYRALVRRSLDEPELAVVMSSIECARCCKASHATSFQAIQRLIQRHPIAPAGSEAYATALAVHANSDDDVLKRAADGAVKRLQESRSFGGYSWMVAVPGSERVPALPIRLSLERGHGAFQDQSEFVQQRDNADRLLGLMGEAIPKHQTIKATLETYRALVDGGVRGDSGDLAILAVAAFEELPGSVCWSAKLPIEGGTGELQTVDALREKLNGLREYGGFTDLFVAEGQMLDGGAVEDGQWDEGTGIHLRLVSGNDPRSIIERVETNLAKCKRRGSSGRSGSVAPSKSASTIDAPLGVAEQSVRSPESMRTEILELGTQAWNLLDEAEPEDALAIAEKAVNLSIEVADDELVYRYRRQSLRIVGAWVDKLMREAASTKDQASAFARAEPHLLAMEASSDSRQRHAAKVERAGIAVDLGPPEEGLRLATEALDATLPDNSDLLAQALITSMHGYWKVRRPHEALNIPQIALIDTIPDQQARLLARMAYYSTLLRAGATKTSDCVSIIDLVLLAVSSGSVRPRRAIRLIEALVVDSNNFGQPKDTLALCEAALSIAKGIECASMTSTISLQAAELAASIGEQSKAADLLVTADTFQEKSHSATDPVLAGLRVNYLFGRARVLWRLAGHSRPERASVESLLSDVLLNLEEAASRVTEGRESLRGDLELLQADLSWWRGRAEYELNSFDRAVTHLRIAHSDAAMQHPRFSVEVGIHAWFLEAEAYYLSGKAKEALLVVESLLQCDKLQGDEKLLARANAFARYLRSTILPAVEWLDSSTAGAISTAVKSQSLKQSIADQLAPLVSRWEEWAGAAKPPFEELFDFWGRGGLLRIAAAIAANPRGAVIVDATSVDEVRRWARLFCPLFDSVIVRWKGPIGEGLVMVPVDLDYGGEGSFGGHGYMVTAGTGLNSPKGREWTVALGWANPLPNELASFLAIEAISLVRGGRLLVVPAPLVGCTQSAVGWTDHLFTYGLLGGPVEVVSSVPPTNTERTNHQAVIDLMRIALPYIADVPLGDLSSVLDDVQDHVHMLQSFLFRSILSDDLRRERWEGIRAIEADIRDATRRLNDVFAETSRIHGWSMECARGRFSAAQAPNSSEAKEPVTSVLRAISSARELAPWFPYWRLQQFGGTLNWSCPIDNPSRGDPERGKNNAMHSWLHPGDAGWTIPTAFIP